ncbi:MAG: sensor histidine kinase KdpD [Cloacibacillus sp.]
MDERPQPEELLREYDLKTAPAGGKLKIFFGYAAGVGKTYAMLEAAHRAQKDGIDVVAGHIEPHTRPETEELLDGLEQLPPLIVKHKGLTLHEFDLDTALKRKPKLILVDELAHTNADSCRHSKRYQDVEELLRAGIDVYTTVNVQHLESLNDLVSSITGVTVRERVPDRIFDAAAQVEVVDIEPDDLIARLKNGKIYREEQAQKALSAFFSKKNLAALREIALRRTADRLNRSAQRTPGGTNAGEHVMTCLSAAPSNAKVIRTAARMSGAFDCRFTALFVETTGFAEMGAETTRRLRQNIRLAEDLGAQITTVYGDDIASQIAEYAKLSGVTKIVLGRTNHRRFIFSPGKSLIDALTTLAPTTDIYIIPDHQPQYRPGFRLPWHGPATALWRTAADLSKGLLLASAATLVGLFFFSAGISEANIIIIYLLAVLLAAQWTGSRLCGAFVSLISVLFFNFFFTEPRFTLAAYDAGYPVTFAVMFLSSCLATSLVLRVKGQSKLAAQKAYRTEVLLTTSQKLQKADSVREILEVTAEQLQKLLERPVLFYTAEADGHLGRPVCFARQNEEFPAEARTEEEKGTAEWVFKNNKHAGATTNTLPCAKCLYLALRGQEGVFAVAGVYMGSAARAIDAYDKNLLLAILGEGGLALERQSLREEKKTIEMNARQEQLRANLLRAISHDLRTPLTSISGSASILMTNSAVLDEEKRKKLCTDIYDDSMWLINLVENLLSVTKTENGKLSLAIEPELLGDVFREAMKHLDRHAAEHKISVHVDDELLMAQMDAHLIVQVVVNLLNNAVKYTPSGSLIRLGAKKEGRRIVVTVTDDGPGIPDEAKKRLFEMFYTAGGARTDSRRGLGLGLSICRSIVEAHGGKISVRDHAPHGTEFAFTLKAAEVHSYE